LVLASKISTGWVVKIVVDTDVDVVVAVVTVVGISITSGLWGL